MTERVNRTLKAQIAIYAQRHPGLWDKEIQKLAFAIRTSINETTGDTPAYLNLGRDPQLPLDLILGNRESGPPPTTLEHQYIRNYRANLTHNLKLAFHLVREHSEIKKLITINIPQTNNSLLVILFGYKYQLLKSAILPLVVNYALNIKDHVVSWKNCLLPPLLYYGLATMSILAQPM
jgi:hypothetical protein